ncbi:MAG: hypothetical protein PHV13_05415 [Candidatus ainarchaeum sp.]|nr:hypothetical protein [Candidatus ainarchaeum sp.]
MQQIVLLLPIVLLLGICGPVTQAAENQTAPPAVVPQTDAETWDAITQANVEAVCLSQAIARAGDLAWAVKRCTCVETLGEGVKDYRCGISTLQGTIMTQITCVRASSMCNVTSPYGNGSITFEQMRQFQAQK